MEQMKKIKISILWAIFLIIILNCNESVYKKLEYSQPLKIKLCDSSLWIKKFKITYFKKNNMFDSVLKIQEINRSNVEFYFYPKNSYSFVFKDPIYEADIKFEIYGYNDSIFKFYITNIKIIEEGYGHDRHAILGSYTINNIEFNENFRAPINLCSLIDLNRLND